MKMLYSLIIFIALFLILLTTLIVIIYKKRKENYITTTSSGCNEGDFLISSLSLCVQDDAKIVVFTLENDIKDPYFCFEKFGGNGDPKNNNQCSMDTITQTPNCNTSPDSIIVDFSSAISFPESDFSDNRFYLIARNFCDGDTNYPAPYKLLITYESIFENMEGLFMYDTDKPPNGGFPELLNPKVSFTDNLKNYLCNTFNKFYSDSIMFYIGRIPPKNSC